LQGQEKSAAAVTKVVAVVPSNVGTTTSATAGINLFFL
jgi:hypothetical protein